MASLLAGATQDFVDRKMPNRIARDLKDASCAFRGFNPSSSEQRSESNSLGALLNAVTLGGFTENGILLAHQLPLSSRRLDAMIPAHAHDGAPAAVIVEPKKWMDREPSKVDECGWSATAGGRGVKLEENEIVLRLGDSNETARPD